MRWLFLRSGFRREAPRCFFPAQPVLIARDNGKTLRSQRSLPRARATLPLSSPSAFALCASSGLGTFLAVADCQLRPRKGSQWTSASHASLRTRRDHAEAAANVRILLNL